MAYFRINEISREPDLDITLVRGVYVDVDFWLTKADFDAGKEPLFSEDFSMQIWVSERAVAKDINGFFLTTGGQAVDPSTILPDDRYRWQYVTTQRTSTQITDQIKTNINNHARRALKTNLRGDRRYRKSITRIQTDADNILSNTLNLRNYTGST